VSLLFASKTNASEPKISDKMAATENAGVENVALASVCGKRERNNQFMTSIVK